MLNLNAALDSICKLHGIGDGIAFMSNEEVITHQPLSDSIFETDDIFSNYGFEDNEEALDHSIQSFNRLYC